MLVLITSPLHQAKWGNGQECRPVAAVWSVPQIVSGLPGPLVSPHIFPLRLPGKPLGHPQHVLILGTALGRVPAFAPPMPWKPFGPQGPTEGLAIQIMLSCHFCCHCGIGSPSPSQIPQHLFRALVARVASDHAGGRPAQTSPLSLSTGHGQLPDPDPPHRIPCEPAHGMIPPIRSAGCAHGRQTAPGPPWPGHCVSMRTGATRRAPPAWHQHGPPCRAWQQPSPRPCRNRALRAMSVRRHGGRAGRPRPVVGQFEN